LKKEAELQKKGIILVFNCYILEFLAALEQKKLADEKLKKGEYIIYDLNSQFLVAEDKSKKEAEVQKKGKIYTN
jgi:hypothetical protein